MAARHTAPAYEYSLVPSEWWLSSFPRGNIPSTVCDAPHMHVFPPIFPSFYDRIKSSNTSIPLTVPTPERRSPRNHSSTPREHSSSLGSRGTRKPTPTTRELLAQLGAVRFISATHTLRELTQSALTSMYAHLSSLDSTQAEFALKDWHNNLRTQEQTLWSTIGPANNPPPYSARGNLPADGYDNIKLVEPTPDREVQITGGILAPSLRSLVGGLVADGGLEVLSSLVYEAPALGSGTSDVALCQPQDMDEGAWKDAEKFLVEVKLLSPDDWKQFLDCFTEREGVKLYIDNDTIKLNTSLPSVWPPVLAQTVEQLHTNRAKYLILTDYDRYMLFTLEDKKTVTVSQIFYRDQGNTPSDTFDPASVDNDTVVMELVLALVLLAKRATHPEALWFDLQPVKDKVREKRKAKRDDERSNLRKKVGKAGASEQSSTATSTTLSLSYEPTVFTNIPELPNYRILPPTGLVSAKLWHSTEPELVSAIVNAAREDVSPDSSFGSDSVASLTWSWSSSEGSDGSAIEVTLSRFIGRGRTWDAFTATLTARVGTDIVSVPAIVKHIDLAALETFEQAQAGYPELADVLVAVDCEVSALQVLAARAPGIAPRLLAHWTIGDHILLATEDCGPALSARDEATCEAVLDAYARVHAAGLLHGDVSARHVCGGRGVRLIDWEGAYAVEDGDPGAVANELAEVRAMLGLAA